MSSIFVTIQFILVVVICICVLLQKSSSIGLGAYSGSNESLFGAKGPAGFLAKFTFFMGFLLVANTIYLGYLYNKANDISLITDERIEQNSLLPQGLNLDNKSESAAAAVNTANSTKEENSNAK